MEVQRLSEGRVWALFMLLITVQVLVAEFLPLLDTPDKNRQYLDESCKSFYVIKIAWSSRLDG